MATSLTVKEAWRLGEGEARGKGSRVKELITEQILTAAWVSLMFVGWYLGGSSVPNAGAGVAGGIEGGGEVRRREGGSYQFSTTVDPIAAHTDSMGSVEGPGGSVGLVGSPR